MTAHSVKQFNSS